MPPASVNSRAAQRIAGEASVAGAGDAKRACLAQQRGGQRERSVAGEARRQRRHVIVDQARAAGDGARHAAAERAKTR